MSFNSFFWGGFVVSDCQKICSLHQNRNLDWAKLAKCFIIKKSRYSKICFSKTALLKFLSTSEVTAICFRVLIRRIIQWFCPLRGNIDRLNLRNGPCTIFNLSISSFINIWSYRLEFFHWGLYRDVLLSILDDLWMWFVVCSLNFPMGHINGKYRSATAPLVFISAESLFNIQLNVFKNDTIVISFC